VPTYPWFPDGHISVLKTQDGAQWMMFWPEWMSYRTVGASPHPEDQNSLSPTNSIIGNRTAPNTCGWDNGGSWLMSVHRVGTQLVSFYHAEDHWCNGTNPQDLAYKSMARTVSSDDGKSWSLGQPIIRGYVPRPATPAWSGAGDGVAIWDDPSSRWYLYYQENIGAGAQIFVASSTDATGAVGTWRKWDGTAFSIDALLDQSNGGKAPSALPAFLPHEGANPSIHFNTLLAKWVMVYGGWDGIVYMSASTDLIAWETPRSLVGSQYSGGRAWYPTVIGDSDLIAGASAHLYYADITADFSSRQFLSVPLAFNRAD
jgi:hypothetical protein